MRILYESVLFILPAFLLFLNSENKVKRGYASLILRLGFVGNGRRSEQNGGLHLCRRPNSPHSSLFFFFFFFFFLLGFISGRNFVFEANSCRRIYRHTRAKNLYNVGR